MNLLIAAVWENKILRGILLVLLFLLLCFGLYEGGKYAQRKTTDAINTAKNEMLESMQKSLQTSVNTGIGNIQSNLDSNIKGIDKKLEENKNAIAQSKSGLDSLGPVWLRVDDTGTAPGVSSNNTASKIATAGSTSDGAHYARLSDSSLQFLKGEAYRADQCAVSLNKVQGDLVETRAAFQSYMDSVTAILQAAKIK